MAKTTTETAPAGKGKEIGQVARYLVTGVGTSLLDLSLYSLLSVLVGIAAVPSNVCSTIITVTVSYFINRAFVFRAGPPSWRGFFSFAGLTLFTGLVLQSGVIWTITELGASYLPLENQVLLPLAKIIAMAVGATCNYVGYRFIFGRELKE